MPWLILKSCSIKLAVSITTWASSSCLKRTMALVWWVPNISGMYALITLIFGYRLAASCNSLDPVKRDTCK